MEGFVDGKSTAEGLGMRFVLIFVLLVAGLTKPSFGENANIPRILSDGDIKLYRQIADVQRGGDWDEAQELIDQLENPLLIGHVTFQRLMHPTKYRSTYGELAGWMRRHADHPNAWRIYRLAKRRQGRSRAPRRPDATRYPGVTGQSALPKPPTPRRTKADNRRIREVRRTVRRYIRKGQSERAEKRVWAIAERGILADFELAALFEQVSSSYYYEGEDEKALVLATYGAELGREIETETDWIAGLANWRLGDIATAYDHFQILGEAERAGDWLGAAGDYWAARSAFRLGDAPLAQAHLIRAAERFETFYGLLASRQLGITPRLDWAPPVLSDAAVTRLLTHPAVIRAIALAEIGRDDLADEELRLLWGREGTTVQDDLLALAAHLRLPAIQLRIGRTGGTDTPAPTAVRYPLPDWAPANGFSIDRALIFGMMRQESDFGARANSRVGARGLLQVMPATASFISRDSSLFRRNKNRLYEPEFNMALGQAYVEKLISEPFVEANLLMMLAAYNAGPGSLLSWKDRTRYNNDPLLFIESIGFFETRHFIERVMSNLWLYRLRLSQPTPSLDALASGAWPALEQLDTPRDRAVAAERQRRLAERKGFYAED